MVRARTAVDAGMRFTWGDFVVVVVVRHHDDPGSPAGADRRGRRFS